MKKLLSIIALAVCTTAQGFVVSDPTSHGYFIEQITQLEKQIKQAKQTYDTMERTRQQVERFNLEITGSYDNATGLYGMLKAIYDKYQGMYGKLSDKEKDVFNKEVENKPSQDYKDLDAQLKKWGYDPNSGDIYSNTDLAEARMHDRQKRIKESIITADINLKNIKSSVGRLQDLGAKIDKTQNIKDSQDLTNRILVEQLMYLQSMTQLLSTYVSASMAIQYAGYNELADKKTQQRLAGQVKKNNDPRVIGAFNGFDYSSCANITDFKKRWDCKRKIDKENWSKGILKIDR